MPQEEKTISAEGLADVQVKEEGQENMTDEQLLTLIDSWLEETKPYFTELKSLIERNLEYYKGNQTEVEKIRGRNSKAVENRVFMATETIVPIITSRPPDMVAEAPSDDEKAEISAAKLQKALMYHYDRLQMKDNGERFVRDMVLKRFGVFKLDWDTKSDDFCVKVVDPRRIRFVKYGKTVDELPAILEELEISYTQASDYFGKSVADELLKEKGESESDMKKRKTTFKVWEVWTNDFCAWKSGNRILKKEDNRWWDYEDLSKNFFDAPKKPYVIRSLFNTDESLIGETDLITQVIPIQDNINKRKRQIENISAKAANPILLIDSDVMDEETASSITNEEGLIMYGKDVAQLGKVRFESPGQIPQYVFNDLISSRQEFDNIFGTHATTRGEQSGSRTLGQDVLVKQGDLGRIDLIKRRYDSAIGELANWFTQIMKIEYDNDRIIRLVGSDGDVEEFSIEDIENGVKIVVKAGTAIPTDELSVRSESTNLFQLGVLDPLTLYEKLKFPNPKETFMRLAKFRTGELFKEFGGQGALPGESGNPSAENLGQLSGATSGGKSVQQNLKQGRAEIKQALQ